MNDIIEALTQAIVNESVFLALLTLAGLCALGALGGLAVEIGLMAQDWLRDRRLDDAVPGIHDLEEDL